MIAVRWCLIRHPDLADAAPAPVAEDALAYYEPRGWARVSGWTTDPHTPVEAYPRHEDAPEPEPEPKPAKTAAKSSSKENA